MALSALWTQAQLEIACGGASRLVQLAGAYDSTDPTYATFIAEVREASDTDAYSLAQVAFNPADPNVQYIGLLRQKSLAVAVYWAWSKGTGGQAIPEEVAKAHDRALDALQALASGDRALGSDAAVSTSAGLTTIDPNPDGTRITRASLGTAGFA